MAASVSIKEHRREEEKGLQKESGFVTVECDQQPRRSREEAGKPVENAWRQGRAVSEESLTCDSPTPAQG